MGQQILGSYPVHFHLAEDVDERGGYEHPMCLDNLAITTASLGVLPHVEPMAFWAVSTFWTPNPNNNLTENEVTGAQGVRMWCLFHLVPRRQSEGRYPEGQAEHTPLGCFTSESTRFKAGLFIGKGVKTRRANAEDPRESPTVDNARFLPHQDADPENPRVPAMIDGLIAPKNNDHGAWARAGDIIFHNSRFSDNGIGLTLASDGAFTTGGWSPEVTRSIFVGESSNFGSQGGQNSYWGKGAHGEHRTPPRNNFISRPDAPGT